MNTFYSSIGWYQIPIKVDYTILENNTSFRLMYLEDFILLKGDIERGYIWFKTPDDLPYDIFFMADLMKEYPSVISKEGDSVEFSIKLDKRIHKRTKTHPNGIFHMNGCGIQIKQTKL
jgi:hypothetical protein